MWHSCTFPSSQMQFDVITWLWVIFLQACTVAHKSRGSPSTLLPNLACFASQISVPEIFQRWIGDKREREAVEKWGWKASDTLVMAVPTCLVMKDHEWYLESPCRAKTLETKGAPSLPRRKSTSHFDDDFVIHLVIFSSCDGEVLWAERVIGLQDAEGV